MRKTNWRLVIVGLVLIVAACGFFAGMGVMATRSNDPVAMMQTVGTVSGVVGAIGAVMAVFGFIGRRTA
jgi:ABC-type lipoprotein release transport system permease subunit